MLCNLIVLLFATCPVPAACKSNLCIVSRCFHKILITPSQLTKISLGQTYLP